MDDGSTQRSIARDAVRTDTPSSSIDAALRRPGDAVVRSGDAVVRNEFFVRHSYDVHFTRGLFEPANALLATCVGRAEPERRHKLFAVVDGGVASARPRLPGEIEAYCQCRARQLELAGPPLIVPGGEACKNEPAALQSILDALHQHRIDRHSFVLAIGGGAVLDLAGYAAATVHRGLRLIRVPTTVLAQNDAGVGVKNGINAFGNKNYLGTFAPPWAVLDDADFLDTLDPRDRIAGIAEAVKVALIRDAAFFGWLEDSAAALAAGEPAAMATMIRRCAELHIHHIATGGDPFELGSARPLDYGHWSAHRLETMTAHALRHGEAVAIGVALDTRYAVAVGLLDETSFERVYALLQRIGFRLWHDSLDARDARGRLSLLRGIDDFREHLGGDLTIGLLTAIGTAVDVQTLDESMIAGAVAWLRERDGRTCGQGGSQSCGQPCG
ncbi:MAG: 3-dehydroquinate synthase [Rhodospirillales bacterium]|nr:3-dehydroquinate synthase [Rhodospirillales bacterium]